MDAALAGAIIIVLWTTLLIGVFYLIYRRRTSPSTATLAALANVRDGVLIFDLKNQLINMNVAARQILKYEREPITGKLVRSPKTDWGRELSNFLESGQTNLDLEIEGRYYELALSPLSNRRKQVIGRIVIIHDVTDNWRAAETALAAEQMAEARANELEILKNLAEILNQTLPPEKALEAGLEMVAQQMGSVSAWLLTLTPDQKADLAAGYQLPANLELARSGGGPWALCACLKSSLEGSLDTPTLFDCERLARTPGQPANQKHHLSIPVRASGVRVGILNLVIPDEQMIDETHLRLVASLGDQFGGALERARLFKEVHKLAITDPLTGMFNRRHFFAMAIKEIERSRRYQHPLSLAMMDIDHFKHINDTYGHLAGDQALQAVAQICQDTIRRIDLIGRFGGEEILILMPETSQEKAEQAMERLRLKVEQQNISTLRGNINITVSIGMVSLTMDGNLNFETLIERADQALYKAKNSGRNQVKVFEN